MLEQRLLDLVDEKRTAIIEFTRELLQTPSENPKGDEKQVVSLIQDKMTGLGIEDIGVIAKQDNRPNLIGWVRGRNKGRVLLYNAHTDTKPIGSTDDWSVDPYAAPIVDNVLYGRGTVDMKGALAAMLFAASVIQEAGLPLNGDLMLAFTADEESGSLYGTNYLIQEAGVKADAGLIGEPSGIESSFDSLCIACRGSHCFKIKVHGTEMHSSQSDIRNGVNASVKLAEVMLEFSRRFKPSYSHPLYPQGVTVNLGVMLKGGVFYGMLPGLSEFASEIRTLPGMTRQQTVGDLQSFVDQLRQKDPDLNLELESAPEPLDWIRPMEISADEPIVQETLAAAETVLGFKPRVTGFTGGTDAPVMTLDGGFPTIPAFGPGLLFLAHGPDEHVDVEDIIKATKIYALAATNYLGREM